MKQNVQQFLFVICKICHLVLLHVLYNFILCQYVNIRTTEILNRKCSLASIFFLPLHVYKLPLQNSTPSFTYFIIKKNLKEYMLLSAVWLGHTLDFYGYKVFLPSSILLYTHISIAIKPFVLFLLSLPFLRNLRNLEFPCHYFSFFNHHNMHNKTFLLS